MEISTLTPSPFLELPCEIWNMIFNVYSEYRVIYRCVCRDWRKWVKDLPKTSPKKMEWIKYAGAVRKVTESAAVNGEMSLLFWIASKSNRYSYRRICNASAYGGHPEVLDWILNQHISIDYMNVCYYASLGGSVSVFHWIHDKLGAKCICRLSRFTAAGHGKIEVLDYLIWIFGWAPEIAAVAILNHQFHLADWILDKGYYIDWNLIKEECEMNPNTKVLKWVLEHET